MGDVVSIEDKLAERDEKEIREFKAKNSDRLRRDVDHYRKTGEFPKSVTDFMKNTQQEE